MEAAVLLGILGAGYLLNNSNNSSNNDSTNDSNSENVNLPSESEAYNTNYFKQSKEDHTEALFKSYEKTKIPGANIVNYQNIDEYLNQSTEDPTDNDKYLYSNISGAKIAKENFLVNDQGIKLAPYFKGDGPPNINLDDGNVQLKRHQGDTEFKMKKTEQPNFFQPFKQENVFGSQFQGDLLQSKFVSSKINNNVLPFETQMVQPIDEKNQIIGDISRQYYEKSKTENIRSLNNQKESYGGRVLSGKEISKRGKIGQVFEHAPMTDYYNSPDKWLVTNGAYVAETERPEQIMPNTNRQFFNKQEFGPATGVDVEEPSSRPKFALSNRQTFASDTVRNAGTSVGQMNNENIMNSTMIYPNERDVTTLRTYDSNIKPGYDKLTLGVQDKVKTTIKETTIDPANNGFLSGTDLPTERLYDEVKNTKKQFTTYDENYLGVGGTNVPQPMNENQYENAEVNATKEIIAQGRYPTPQGDKYYNSVEAYNIEIKKNEQDYFNHRQTHYDKMNPEYLAKNTCNFTQFKNKLDDTSIGSLDGGRIDPNLLSPFKNNPYTQSLESFAY